MQCLGLDIGSSSIKGAILDLATGQVHSIVKESFPDPLPGLPTGWFEIDPLEVVARTRRVISQLIALAPEASSLFLCGQMGGVVGVDSTNRPITNYLSWRDQRTLAPHRSGGTFLDEIQRLIGPLPDFESPQTVAFRSADERTFAERKATVITRLGNELKPGSATSLLFWLQQSTPLPSGVRPASMGDFVISQLSGSLPRMERTQAIGLVDLSLDDWNPEAFQSLGLGHLDWGQLAPLETPVAHCTIDGRPLALHPTLGDQQCALRGAGLQLGDLSINVSTGSQVSCLTREFTPGPYQSRYFFNGTYLNTITHLPAGRSLNALLALVTELNGRRGSDKGQGTSDTESTPPASNSQPASPWPYIAQAAAAAPDGAAGLLCGLGFFDGPLGREGHITGITTENLTIGHLFRAAFESMAQTYARLARTLWPSGDWQRVVLSGGLTQSVPILRDLIERRFPSQIVESPATEETLLGLLDVAREVSSLHPNR